MGTLVDAEKRHWKHPTTFEIPAKETRSSLKPGDFAKVIYESKDAGCRVWVKIAKRTKGGYSGILDNDDEPCTGKRLGSRVTIRDKHVIDTLASDGETSSMVPVLAILGIIALGVWFVRK